MKILKTIYLIIMLSTFHVVIFADLQSDKAKPEFNITKIDKPIKINGKMDNMLWLKAEPIEIAYEFVPKDNELAKERTIVKALYDDEYLYFGFKCYDSHPEKIRANLSERDKIFSDDYVILIIDTYGDAQKGYEIAVNPLGIQGDLLATFNNEDINFNMIYYTAAEKNDSGWTAEMAIPFSSLSFDDVEEPVWGFNAVRTIPRESRTQNSWVPIDKNIPGFMTQSGILKGLKNLTSSSYVELLPYVIGQNTGNISDYDNPSSEFKYNSIEGRIGGGIKYSPNSNLAFEAVLNPDFSQIEADADQISVNTTFALFYEEKRPFFLTGNELLQQPIYYSRSINNPLAASRIVGKSGKLSYLYLGAYDRNTVFVVPGEEESSTVSTNKKSFANIGRLRYDFGDEDFIGAKILTRNLNDGHNYVGGIDWNFKFWSNWIFEGQAYLSQTNEITDSSFIESERIFGTTKYTAKLDGEKYSGNVVHLFLSRSEKSFYFNIESNHINPTFQTYNGLLNVSAFREQKLYNSYRIYPDSSFFDRIDINLISHIQHSYNGILREYNITPAINLNMKGQTYFYAQYNLLKNEMYKNEMFKEVRSSYFELNTRPEKEISISTYGSIGKFIYRSDDPTIGVGHNLGASLTLKPTSNLNISFYYDRARLSDKNSDKLFYDGNIYRGVAIYQFTAEAFLRTIFQYNSFNKTFRFYPLFSYQIGAFTTFYAGATSNYTNYKQDFGIVNTDQQYFIKLQYLVSM
ncbi:MAG: carbohydrate binding family 9 domain-containing protein [Ignavibacteriales bacterium]|nr:carbohydrate binding family 9 domain-containing protein [Ignavibacteriales bacterium]